MEKQIKHYRGIKVRFLGPTNFKGLRICLTDKRMKKKKIINYTYNGGSILDQAINYLINRGFSVVGTCELKNC